MNKSAQRKEVLGGVDSVHPHAMYRTVEALDGENTTLFEWSRVGVHKC